MTRILVFAPKLYTAIPSGLSFTVSSITSRSGQGILGFGAIQAAVFNVDTSSSAAASARGWTY